MEGGGLVLAPVAVFGVLGLLRCLVQPHRRGLWLLFAAAGFVVPLLSTAMVPLLSCVIDGSWALTQPEPLKPALL